MTSPGTAMQAIRENIRDVGRQNRSKQRGIAYNQRRGTLGTYESSRRIETKEVENIAVQMKSKPHPTLEDLITLKQAFIQEEENITIFLKAGALHLITKELSGQNAILQLAAADCCCNLALGSNKHCQILAKATSPYLITLLDTLNKPLIDVCAWTLGNLAGSGQATWSILNSQGLGTKLSALLSSENESLESFIYALTHFVRVGFNLLSPTELHGIACHAIPLLTKEPSVYLLLYLLSCSTACDKILLDNNVAANVVHLFASENSNMTVLEETALVRVLGNLSGEVSGQGSLQVLEFTSEVTYTLVHLLSSSHPHLCRETLWLVGNLINHPVHDVKDRFFQVTVESNIMHVLSTAITSLDDCI